MDELQETLKDLRGVHVPDSVSAWPPALGWWVLLGLLFLLALFLRWWLKNKKTTNYQKIANEELENIITNYEIQRDSHKAANELALLIRRIVTATDSQVQAGTLFGNEWLAYLDNRSGSDLFTIGAGSVLSTVVYQKQVDVDMDGLIAATRILLKNV